MMGWTPLHEAAKCGDLELVRTLIEQGADLDATDSSKLTPFLVAWIGAHDNIATLLLDHGASTNPWREFTPLHIAAAIGDMELIRKLLSYNADLNASDENANTPLRYVAYKGRKRGNMVEVATLLIDRGANLNAQNNDGSTLLHEAVFTGMEGLVSLLLDKGADLDLGNKNGATPLHIATANGKVNFVKMLLDRGAEPDIGCGGMTPLLFAVVKGHAKIAEMLVEYGADPDRPQNDRNTPLTIASESGQHQLMNFFLQSGANSLWNGVHLGPEAYTSQLSMIAKTYVDFLDGKLDLTTHMVIARVKHDKLKSIEDFWLAHNLLLLAQRCDLLSGANHGPDHWFQELYEPMFQRADGSESFACAIMRDAKRNDLVNRPQMIPKLEIHCTSKHRTQNLGRVLANMYNRLFWDKKNGLDRSAQFFEGMNVECRSTKNVEESLRQVKRSMDENASKRAIYFEIIKLGISFDSYCQCALIWRI